MKKEGNEESDGPLDAFPPERSMELVDRAMFDDRDEPDHFIRMLLVLHDRTRDPDTREALFHLIEAAYNCSLVRENALERYLDALRTGREPTAELKRTRRSGSAEGVPDNRNQAARRRVRKTRKLRRNDRVVVRDRDGNA